MKMLFERLKKISVSSLADVNKSIRVVAKGIRRYAGIENMVGVARVVSCHNDFLKVLRTLDEAKEGDVLVVEAKDSNRAVLGGLFCTEAHRRGLAGIVVDGPIRDIVCVEKLDLPVYARYLCPCAGSATEVSITKEPILVGDVEVYSGDVIVGDGDGIVVGDLAFFQNIIGKAEEIEKKEQELMDKMKNGIPLSNMLNLREYIESLRRGESGSLQFKIEE